MTTPASGLISADDILAELELPAHSAISLNDSRVRLLANKPSGAISSADLRNKTYLYLISGNSSGSVGFWAGSMGGISKTAVRGFNIQNITITAGILSVSFPTNTNLANVFQSIVVGGQVFQRSDASVSGPMASWGTTLTDPSGPIYFR